MSITGIWDGRISRRTLLRTGGSAAAGIVLLGSTPPTARAVPPFSGDPFSLGVASGDPTPDGIVLWTRLAPDPLEGGGLPREVFGVRFEVAADEDFRQIVRRGSSRRCPRRLTPSTPRSTGSSPRPSTGIASSGAPRSAARAGRARRRRSGRRRTRSGSRSCRARTTRTASIPRIGDIADQKQLELVVHLGDYIYEGSGLGTGNPGIRAHLPAAELLSLSDYRTRHAQYKTDPDLQEAHATHPFLMTWDDHEFKDNYADLDLDPDQPLADVVERRAAAYLAYWEHSPLSRSRKPVGKDMNLYRRARWGELATFHVLDTRQYRSDQMLAQCTAAERGPSGYCPVQLDPARSLLGAEQRDWLFEGLAAAPASGWNVLANQVGFAPQANFLAGRRCFNADSWDGYVADRQRVLDFLKQNDDQEHGRDHRRQAPELRPQRAGELHRHPRAGDRHGVRRHVDQHRGQHAAQHDVRRRSRQRAHPVRELPARLRAGPARTGALDERLPRRGHGQPA